MKILSIGGGPAGLYFGLLMKKQNRAHEVTVIERNRPYDTFGWGVVFSDQTLSNLVSADEETAREILGSFNHWNDIDVHFGGKRLISGGHGFCGIGRKRLLNILQKRCEEVGVTLVFETEVNDDQEAAIKYDADLVIASDGLNSTIRARYAKTFQPDIDTRFCRFVWLGTKKLFKDFTFLFEQTEHGWFQAHIYQFDGDTSTFIIETPEDVWQKSGLEEMSQLDAIAFCEKLFARDLDGEKLISNATHLQGSAIWIRFPRVICKNWIHWNTIKGKRVPTILMGDAAHTAHFSIGSGTKLAMEDAIELAHSFERLVTAGNEKSVDMQAVLQSYQDLRSVEVLKIQSAARNAMEWFENVGRYTHFAPEQFNYSLLTRSQRITHENLRVRDEQFLNKYERWFAERAFKNADLPLPASGSQIPPMLTPFKIRDLVLKNRIAVSPMAQYSAQDGVPGDYHLVHLGSRAMGGAGLVFAEMTCVTADARITEGCPGMYTLEHTTAWKRIVDFVHQNSDAKIAMQLGHAGAKGATKLAWEGMDVPLENGGWPLISASAQQYLENISQTSRAMTRADMVRVKADFMRATEATQEAGFDWLELHCAHGYLLSSFISPLTNRRSDEYGGSLENRLKFPIEVFKAMRQVWPAGKPISVRISAHDWVEGGITPSDAVDIAKSFKTAGADLIDCSSGQVSKAETPMFGRMFQTPFSDRIRNEAHISTIAVGAISEADHANTIIAAGRADLCAIARPHLANPSWTLNESAKLGYRDVRWPKQYEAAKIQLERNLEREKQAATAARSAMSYEEIIAKFGEA